METQARHSSAMAKKINTPFGYFGSKNKIALQLCSDLPPHTCWVEAFCGSAALTLRKKPAQIEVINDIDSEIFNFFEQLRKNTAALIEVVKLTPYAEQELIASRIPQEGLSDLERARRFLVQSMMSINGVFGEERGGFSYSDSFSRNGQDARVSRWNNMPKRLEEVVERLKKVRVENKDAMRLIKRYLDRPNTLLYLDPPYLGERTIGYNNEANDVEFHTKMLKLVNKAHCMIFISAYEHPLYDELLTDGWWCKRIIETSTKGSDGKARARKEVVWMNKHYLKALESEQVPMALTQKEKSEGRFNPERRPYPESAGIQLSLLETNKQNPMVGRFEVFKDHSDRKYYFRLKAGNGQTILDSQGYASKQGCMIGISSVRLNGGLDGSYDRKGVENGYIFHLKAANGEVIGHSQRYTSANARENGIRSVKYNVQLAKIRDLSLLRGDA